MFCMSYMDSKMLGLVFPYSQGRLVEHVLITIPAIPLLFAPAHRACLLFLLCAKDNNNHFNLPPCATSLHPPFFVLYHLLSTCHPPCPLQADTVPHAQNTTVDHMFAKTYMQYGILSVRKCSPALCRSTRCSTPCATCSRSCASGTVRCCSFGVMRKDLWASAPLGCRVTLMKTTLAGACWQHWSCRWGRRLSSRLPAAAVIMTMDWNSVWAWSIQAKSFASGLP